MAAGVSQPDYVRTDQLDDAAVPIAWLPRLFNVTDRTIRDWIARDNIATFEHITQTGTGRPQLAIRWGDIPLSTHPTRWRRR